MNARRRASATITVVGATLAFALRQRSGVCSEKMAPAAPEAAGRPRARAAWVRGAPPFAPELTAKLKPEWEARAAEYNPRSRHLEPDGTP
jgi:hypothetical protein